MKFFKCHAIKFKNSKVLNMADQFTEIGPDAFNQTDFEVIIVSSRVKTIRDHAFSRVSNCSILIPSSVQELEPLAFQDMGWGSVIFCEEDSLVHKVCIAQEINFSNDIAACLAKAKELKEIEENNERLNRLREAELKEAERIRKAAQEEAERIMREAKENAEKIKRAAQEEAKNITKTVQESAPLNVEPPKKQEIITPPAADTHTAVSTPPVVNTPPAVSKPIFVDEEHKSRPQPTPQSVVTTPVVNTPPVVSTPIFVDEEHRPKPKPAPPPPPRPTFTVEEHGAFFRHIDLYDSELKEMNRKKRKPAVRSTSVIRNTTPTTDPGAYQSKFTSEDSMRNLDAYDDELREMNRKKQQKDGRKFFE